MTREPGAKNSQAARELYARLSGVRRRFRNTANLTGMAAVGGTILLWLCLACSLDYALMLAWAARAVLLGLAIGASAALVSQLIYKPQRRCLEDDAVALMIERALPAFRSRYIAAVQLSNSDTARKSLVQALISETAALARTQQFNVVVGRQWLRRSSAMLGLLALQASILVWLAGEKTLPLVRRALLSTEPVPRRTKMELLFEKRILAVGDDFLIAVKTGGMIPREGRAQLAFSRGRKQDIALPADPQEASLFSRVIRNVQEPFDLTLFLGDARTDPIRISVRARPVVLGIEATEIFPAYTSRSPERRSVASLKLFAGSKLVLRVNSNTELTHGAIRLFGEDRERPISEAPLAAQRRNRTLAEGEIRIPARDVRGVGVQLVDTDGVESRSSTVYPIELVPDRPPEIKLITPPRHEELLTSGATLLLAFNGKDDFGIARALLHYAVDWTEGAEHQTIEFDLGRGQPKELMRRFEWKIGEFKPALREGQVVDYWIELIDANDVTGPGISALEHHQVRIVTPIEKRAELAARLSDAMQGLSEARENQDRLNQTLGEFIFAKPAGVP